MGALNFQGNPSDNHTLNESIEKMERVVGVTPEKILVGKGYRGHDYKIIAEAYFPGEHGKRGARPHKWFKRRSAV